MTSGAGRHARVRAWRRLLRYSEGVRGRVLCGGLLTFLGTAASLAQPLTAQRILTAVTLGRPVLPLLAVLAGAVLVGAALSAVGYYLLEFSGETVVRTMRIRLVRKILRLPVSVTEAVKPGDLMSRLVADTTLLRQITTQGLVTAVTGAIGLLGTLVLMGLLDWLLLGVTLGSVALVAVTVRWSGRRVGPATGQVQAAVAAMAAHLDRGLGALRTVKAAGAEAGEIEQLTDSAKQAWRSGLRLARWQAISGTASILTLQISFLAVLGVGGARVASHAIDVSTLIAFMLFMLYLNHPITALSGAYGQYQTGLAAAARLDEILAMPDEPTAPAPDEPALSPAARQRLRSATVDFQDVVFAYSPTAPYVHRGLTFSVPSGGLTAIVGPSGAGKSTVFALIERFHEVSSGRILIAGRDVRDWPLTQLRGLIGYVEQDAPVLAGTLRENLSLGLGTTSETRLHNVLATVRLDDLVVRLPGGLDGQIGYRGGTLSGGERQRLAIARAMLRSPGLLLLDEATSQLDAHNEQALRDAISAAARTATVMVVAHRLSTVINADSIVVMESGTVRSQGTHAQLLETDRLYRSLAATQLLVQPTEDAVPQLPARGPEGAEPGAGPVPSAVVADRSRR